MWLKLGYGQDRPDDQCADFGFDGPSLDGIVSIESTYYATTITVAFRDVASFNAARAATGWMAYDETDLVLEAETLGPFVVTIEPDRPLGKAFYANVLLVDDERRLAAVGEQLGEIERSIQRLRAELSAS